MSLAFFVGHSYAIDFAAWHFTPVRGLAIFAKKTLIESETEHMPPGRTTLGSVLAAARKKPPQLSLREVADKVKKEDGTPISPQYLNDIEHDRRVPSPDVLEGLARALKIDSDYLHFLAGSMPSDLKGRAAREEKVVEAYRLFRKNLG